MIKNELLTAYWVTFPDYKVAPIGIGVTAYSIEDAYYLMKKRGYDYHCKCVTVVIQENVQFDELDHHIQFNMGPIVFRGVWYPCQNIGFAAPRG